MCRYARRVAKCNTPTIINTAVFDYYHEMATNKLTITACWLLILVTGLQGQSLTTVSPDAVGLSSEHLNRATIQLQQHVESGDIAGVVAAVVRHGQLAYLEALGQIDTAQGKDMPADALFRLYSMTRPITSLAAMMLWEEGKFELTDPISKFLPAFADQRVLQSPDRPAPSATIPRRGDITVEHLLTHTSGLGGRNSAMYRAEQVRLRSISIEDMVANAARVPLYEHPGTRWRYGISTTILGRLVEVWSGMSLDTFFKERIFKPLEMTDTVFWVDDARMERFGPAYRPNRTGILQPHQIELIPFTEQPTLTEGGVGLVSTVPDYLRFAQMFLNDGTWNGQRILRPATVALMTTNRLPTSVLPIGFGSPQPGRGWGLGFCVVMDANDFPYPVNQGTYWWDGSSGTRFFIDPVYDMVTVIMAAVSPANGNSFREAFTNTIYDAVIN